MLKRLKRCLVENYIGAIALGWLLGEGILEFTSIFTAPIGSWIARSELRDLPLMSRLPQGFLSRATLQEAGGRLFVTLVILLVWYLLMRWLYFKPFEKESVDMSAKTE